MTHTYITAVVSSQHLQFSEVSQLRLCCGESHSLSPAAFGHGSLHLSPQQSKHQLVSWAAHKAHKAYWLLLHRFTAVVRGQNKQVPYERFPLFEPLGLKMKKPIPRVCTQFFILQTLLILKDFRVHRRSYFFSAVTSSTAAQWWQHPAFHLIRRTSETSLMRWDNKRHIVFILFS